MFVEIYNAVKKSTRMESFEKLIESLDASEEVIYIPRLLDASPDIILKYETILFELNRAYYFFPALNQAKIYLADLKETGCFDEGINLQHYMACQIHINMLEGQSNEAIAVQALKALRITYPSFSPADYKGAFLVTVEPQLIYSYAKATQSIDLLQRLLFGIEQSPQDELTKERYLAPVLLDMVEMMAHVQRYDEALALCNKGCEISLRRNKGKYTPDFVFNKIKLLQQLGNPEEAKKWYAPVYFGYIALGRQVDAVKVKEHALQYNHNISTYGAEHLLYSMPISTLDRNSHTKGNTPGEFIAIFRTAANISQSALCEGICPKSTLNRIETGKLRGTLYQIESLMQRLGRYNNYYFTMQLYKKDFINKQMRDEIRTRLVTRQFNEAETLLYELKKKKSFAKGIGKQFILYSEATLLFGYNKRGGEYVNLLKQAWNITKKGHDIDTAHKGYLSNMEITLLNNMATYLCANGEPERGIRMLENIRHHLNFRYEDELERIKSYIMILFNLTTVLARAKMYTKVLEIIPEAENLCLKFEDLRQAYRIAGNKASALVGLNRKDECYPFMAISYYVAELLGFEQSKTAAKKYAAEKDLHMDF